METLPRRGGLEESLKSGQPQPPSPQLLNQIAQWARTFTGNYKLTLVPWQPQPGMEYDWPQWRLIPSSNQLQYVAEDFKWFPAQNILGRCFEAIAMAVSFRPEVVEEEYQTQGAFWALMTAAAIPWARGRIVSRFPGLNPDFAALDDLLYGQREQGSALPLQKPVFLQFIEAVLYEGRRGREIPWPVLPAVREALAETSSLRREILTLELEPFYEQFRDRLWPVGRRLLEEEMKQEMFSGFQKEPSFRAALGLGPLQKLLGWQGRLPLDRLTPGQRGRFENVLALRLAKLTEGERVVFRQRLQRRLAEWLLRMRLQFSAGIMPPSATERAAPAEEFLQVQERLRKRAAAAARLAQRVSSTLEDLAKRIKPPAGLEERRIPAQEWRFLIGLAQQIGQDLRQMEADARQAFHITSGFMNWVQLLDPEEIPQTEGLRLSASRLRQWAGNVRNDLWSLQQEADKCLAQLQSAAEPPVSSAGELKKLLDQVEKLRARTDTIWGRLEQVRNRVEESELDFMEMVAEARRLAAGESPAGRLAGAAQKIAEWANPALVQAKVFSEALAQTILRILQRLRRLQERLDAEGSLEEKARQAVEEELRLLTERIEELMERFGVPEQVREKWRNEADQLDIADLEEILRGILGEGGGQGSGQGMPGEGEGRQSQGGVYELLGSDLLKVVPPASPVGKPGSARKPGAPTAGGVPPPAAGPAAPSSGAKVRPDPSAGNDRQGIVAAQIPLYQQYVRLRRSLISTAGAHLFQWSLMRRGGGIQTDLLEGELDEENLALARTGTRRLFLEEKVRKEKDADRLLLLVDVSYSMLKSADEASYPPREGERKLDYVLDLLITLAEAAGKRRSPQVAIVIFSSWTPKVSVVVKGFDERWSLERATQVIDQVLNCSHDGTRDAQAVEEAIPLLREGAGPGSRKMLWVLTDGGGQGAAAMQEMMRKNPDISVFGWGLGPAMKRDMERTYGPRGIWIPRMQELARKGWRVLSREMNRPVRPRAPGSQSGLEELPEGLRPAEDGWPLDFPRLAPIQDRPGAGELEFHREGEKAWFEVDGIRIDPPELPKVTLSDWTVGKLQEMWDVIRLPPEAPHSNLLLYGQAGVGKSLYARYLWEIYRRWFKGRAARMEEKDGRQAELKAQALATAEATRVRVVTFHEGLRKADLTERLHLGEDRSDETGFTPGDIVQGGEKGDLVILSEVNRSADEVLSVLDEPLGSRRMTLYERVRRFHPNARLIAAINPPEGEVAYAIGYKGRELSGQFLGHFTKVELDYPRPKLEDGRDNPEHPLFVEHEKQVLMEVRRRKNPDGGWAVSDDLIASMVQFAGMVREDALSGGQAPFIFSTRALVRMVEAMDRFPHLMDRIPDVFFNAYWVDDTVHGEGTREHLMGLMRPIFRPANWQGDWPAPRPPAGRPKVVSEEVDGVLRDFLTYPHWPPDVRIPLGPGTGKHIPAPVLFELDENLRRLEDLLMDVALKRNILNMGDSDTGQSYFMRVLAKVLRRNLIVLTLSQGFKVREMLVMRWYSQGKTGWKDSLPLSHLRPEKVREEGPPVILLDRGEKGDPATLVAFNDLLMERRILLPTGEEFFLPEEAVVAMNRTPPRPPYEFHEQSGEFSDRFSHRSYGYLLEESEVEILHGHYPGLARGSVLKVVQAANCLRGLFQQSEIFEPPGIGMAFTAVGLMAQRPQKPVRLADLIIRAHGPLKAGEKQKIRQALEAAGLDMEIHPSIDPEMADLMTAFKDIRWDPAVQKDPALWRQAVAVGVGPLHAMDEAVLVMGQPVQIGWGLELRPVEVAGSPVMVEMVPLAVGLDRPFLVYDHLAEALRRKAQETGARSFRLNDSGILYQTSPDGDWSRMEGHFSSPESWSGLRDFFAGRGLTGRAWLTIELAAEDEAAWKELAWALDPVTLRRNIPAERAGLQRISGPLRLDVAEGRPLERLAGFSVGMDAADPAGRSIPAGFLIRRAVDAVRASTSSARTERWSGLEEAAASPIRRIPVIGGFVSHGDDPESVRMLGEFESRLDGFLKEHPRVKHLLIVEELGAPFLLDLLGKMGIEAGQLAAAGRASPEGLDQVVRPAFEQAMRVAEEEIAGWWSRIHAGELPEIAEGTWMRRLFKMIHQKARQGYEIHRILEEPPFETWWWALLAQENFAVARDEIHRAGKAGPQDRQVLIEAVALLNQNIRSRDESLVSRQIIPLLEEVFGEETEAAPAQRQPEDPALERLEPEELAVVIPRGRLHAPVIVPLLEARFSQVRPVLREELIPGSPLDLLGQYGEALVKGKHPAGQAPAEVEKLLDDQIEQWLAERQKAGLEEQRPAADQVAAQAVLDDLARKWGWTDLRGWRIAAISAQAVSDNPRLRGLAGRPVAIGKVILAVVPELELEMEDLLGRLPAVAVQGYGPPGDRALDLFLKKAQEKGFLLLGRISPADLRFSAFSKAILWNLSRLPPDAVDPEDLLRFEKALESLA